MLPLPRGIKRPLESAESTPTRRRQSGVPIEGSTPGAGDPKVSKPVTACTECQRRKIKCDLAEKGEVCGRCEKKGLQCVVNKSLQTLLKDEAQWKASMEGDVSITQDAVSEILKVLNLPALETFGRNAPRHQKKDVSILHNGDAAANVVRFSDEQPSPPKSGPSQRVPAAMAMTRENSQEPESHDQEGTVMVTDPMGSLYEVTKLRNLRSNPKSRLRQRYTATEDDFISSGKVSLADAEHLYDYFARYLNAYLWGGIALVHSSLLSVRQSSSLLLASILTVSALHVPGMEDVFDRCYAELVGLICDSMLDRYHTLDGVRGLAIGAFWLSDLSWKLSGHAVRIATELNLHQCYSKLIRGDSESFEGARLWFLLYVCDHHFSIAYGRPPVIHESITISKHDRFLQLPQATQSDVRLHSQVAIFVILTDIYNAFGQDVDLLTDEDLDRVKHFNLRLDQYHMDWQHRLTPNSYIGSYPAKGVDLHCHYAKLQLNSFAIRGANPDTNSLSPIQQNLAETAVSSAARILRLTLNEPDIRSAIVGVPLYLHTMITYATVFLLKIQQKWQSTQLGITRIEIRNLVRDIVRLFREAKASRRHLAYHIAHGLSKMLDRYSIDDFDQPAQLISDTQGQSSAEVEDTDLGANAFNDLAEYDQYLSLDFFDILSAVIPE